VSATQAALLTVASVTGGFIIVGLIIDLKTLKAVRPKEGS